MKRRTAQFARYLFVQIIGVLCIVVGVAGLLLPILNGVFPLAIGVILVAMYNPPMHRHIHAIVRRFPWLEGVLEKTEELFERVFGPSPDGVPPIRNGYPGYQRRQALAVDKATTEGSETNDL